MSRGGWLVAASGDLGCLLGPCRLLEHADSAIGINRRGITYRIALDSRNQRHANGDSKRATHRPAHPGPGPADSDGRIVLTPAR